MNASPKVVPINASVTLKLLDRAPVPVFERRGPHMVLTGWMPRKQA